MSKIIDCKGLTCPKPVIIAKKELESMGAGEVTIVVDNEAARQNLLKLGENMGCSSKAEEKDGCFYVTLTKPEDECCSVSGTNDNKPVILVGSDKFGSGDPALGSVLMKSYMFALSEADVKPKSMIFVNSGVHLTTEGSEVIESLQKLAESGVEIMSCGTCLDFYNLKDKLLIGSITNMYTIVELMNSSSNTIKL